MANEDCYKCFFFRVDHRAVTLCTVSITSPWAAWPSYEYKWDVWKFLHVTQTYGHPAYGGLFKCIQQKYDHNQSLSLANNKESIISK